MDENLTVVQKGPAMAEDAADEQDPTLEADREQARRVKLLKAEVSIGQLASEVSQGSSQLDEVRQRIQAIDAAMNEVRRGLGEVSQLLSFFESQTQAALTTTSQEAVRALADVVEEVGRVGENLSKASGRLMEEREQMESGPQEIAEGVRSELIQLEDRNADRLEAVRQAMASNSKWTVEVLDTQLSRLTAVTKWALVFSVASLLGVTALLVYLLIR